MSGANDEKRLNWKKMRWNGWDEKNYQKGWTTLTMKVTFDKVMGLLTKSLQP